MLSYKVNPDGSVSYNMDYVNSVRTGTGGTEFDVTDLGVFSHRAGDRYVTGDAVTSNGGWVNARVSDDFGSVTIEDVWDL